MIYSSIELSYKAHFLSLRHHLYWWPLTLGKWSWALQSALSWMVHSWVRYYCTRSLLRRNRRKKIEQRSREQKVIHGGLLGFCSRTLHLTKRHLYTNLLTTCFMWKNNRQDTVVFSYACGYFCAVVFSTWRCTMTDIVDASVVILSLRKLLMHLSFSVFWQLLSWWKIDKLEQTVLIKDCDFFWERKYCDLWRC
jgi:hypothetical protein